MFWSKFLQFSVNVSWGMVHVLLYMCSLGKKFLCSSLQHRLMFQRLYDGLCIFEAHQLNRDAGQLPGSQVDPILIHLHRKT